MSKKTLPIFGTVAILCAVLFHIEFATAQEPMTQRSTVPGQPDGTAADSQPVRTTTIQATTDNPFDVSTYPEDFAQIEKEVKEKNGLALIAQVVDAAGNPINRADFHIGSHYEPLLPNYTPVAPAPTYNGWFRTGNILTTATGRTILEEIFSQNPPDWSNPIKFFVYTATNKPIEIEVPVTPGNVYYAQVTLAKTPENELVSLSGIALDDEDKPIADAHMLLKVRGGTGATAGLRQTTTDEAGRFTFDKIAEQAYLVSINKSGYTVLNAMEVPVEKLGEEHVFHYYKQRDIEIEYVFQMDGSRDFMKGDLKPRTVTLKASDYTKGFRFATGDMSASGGGSPESRNDISYRDNSGKLMFLQVHRSSKTINGFYDAGAVPFESIKEADERPEVYPNAPGSMMPVHLNHVYVVKTLDGNYAKFVVRRLIPQDAEL